MWQLHTAPKQGDHDTDDPRWKIWASCKDGIKVENLRKATFFTEEAGI
jgi:hypothetical protein